MTPTNTAMTPEIENIMDNEDVKHTVVPTPHTHSQNEVDGLAAALAAKAKAIPAGSPTGAIVIANTAGELLRSPKTITDLENAIAAKQDALTFDTTPTAESTNPVTSGGVKAAIDDATKAVFGSMPYNITAAHEKMCVHTRILRNNTGATIKLTESIDVSALPAEERANIYWNSPDIDIPNNTVIGIRFVRTSNSVFIFYDGSFDY